jgi:hypothetical protein
MGVFFQHEDIVNQYIDYTSLNEFEFEEQDNDFEDND